MTTELTGKKIGFLGGGNMAEALVKGLLASGVKPADVLVAEPVAARRSALKKSYKVTATAKNADVVRNCEVVVIAVKPQVVGDALVGIEGNVGDQVFVSIAAGVPTARLRALLGPKSKVVRVMPNTPALVGAGAAAIYAAAGVGKTDAALARAVFEAVGAVVEVPKESLMDAVTGLSGSGPAFVLSVLEAMSDAGVKAGLARAQANLLAAQTVLGTAKMASESDKGFAALREMVTSPAGTTIEGLQVLEERGLRAAVMGAVEAAVRRSKELGEG